MGGATLGQRIGAQLCSGSAPALWTCSRDGSAIAMLQVILQVFVDELELSLSAVHPAHHVRGRQAVKGKIIKPTMYSHNQRNGTFLARTHP